MKDDKSFATKILLDDAFGSKATIEYEDVIDIPPREHKVREVIAKFREASNGAEMRASLAPLQDENYDHYERPDLVDLAVDACGKLDTRFTKELPKAAIYTELNTYNAVEKHQPDWIEAKIDRTVLSNKFFRVVKTKSDHLLLVTNSFFIIFAENVKPGHRFEAVRGFLEFMSFLFVCGVVSAEELNQRENMLCSFLMGVEGLQGKKSAKQSAPTDLEKEKEFEDRRFYAARYAAVAKGTFQCRAQKGVLAISSKLLKIGYAEAMLIRDIVGRQKFHELLVAHGFVDGRGFSSIEPNWKCAGSVGIPGLLPRPCVSKSASPTSNMLSAPLFGGSICVCGSCVSRLRRLRMRMQVPLRL